MCISAIFREAWAEKARSKPAASLSCMPFWAVLFVIGLLTVIFRMDISRFLSDETALLAGGAILALFSGAGLLTELYQNKQ